METKKLLKATEPDEVEQMFLDLQQTSKHGTSVIFSFPSPGQVMVLCATSQRRDLKCDSPTCEKTMSPSADIDLHENTYAMGKVAAKAASRPS